MLELVRKFKRKIKSSIIERSFVELYQKYRHFTMIPEKTFIGNLDLIMQANHIEGCVVECGVWRGGMSGAMAEVLGNKRKYFLFDSFEGLPEVKEIDGVAAKAWQEDKQSPIYFDNCKAEIDFAKKAMSLASSDNCEIVKGWFKDTLPDFPSNEKIAVLRLDGDWYDSTMDCLIHLFPKVNKGGIVVIDDYYAWDGCCRALHDYLSKNNLPLRIRENQYGVCYIIKN